MRREAFELLREAESSWWYKGRARIVRAALTRARITAPLSSVLDYGAGYGGMYRELASLSAHVHAYEPDESARHSAREQEYKAVYDSAATALSRKYGLIGLFDVVEHIEDDAVFIESLQGSLEKSGIIAITVPAFPFLWSEHDVMHQHFRRYTKKSLSRLLQDAEYEIDVISYWNTFLFIPAAIVRLLGRSGSSTLGSPGFIHHCLLLIVTVEAYILSLFSLPFGISLVAVAHKKNPQDKLP